jgi:SAM-dependent methyltransferase
MPNWWIKVCLQNALAKLPCGEQWNHWMQELRSGLRIGADDPVQRLYRRMIQGAECLRRIARHVPLEGADVVEVGTGWVPLLPTLLYLCGTQRIRTYDVARHARFRKARQMLAVLRGRVDQCVDALSVPRHVVGDRLALLEQAASLDEMLSRAGIEYHAPADAAATGLPESSVDLHFSWAVFDCMPVAVVHDVCREARRILKPSGRLYAFIGCTSDYAAFDRKLSPLHYLQYTEAQWKRIAMNKIQYINRLREHEYVEIFQQYGGRIEEIDHTLNAADVERVKNMPLADPFAGFTPEQNAVLRTEMIVSFH